MEKFLLSIYFITFLIFTPAKNIPAQLIKDCMINSNGNQRYFDYYLPSQIEHNSPVVIVLHGGNGNKNELLKEERATTEWKIWAEEEKFLLIIPNGSDDTGNTNFDKAHWNDCRNDDPCTMYYDDIQFISDLIDWSIENYCSDPERIYVTGVSNGGMMSYRVGLELAEKVAGIAVFIANLPAHSECIPENIPISVFICNGTDDPLMPWDGGEIGENFPLLENRGLVLSADSTLEFWKNYNNTYALISETEYEDINFQDNSTVSSKLFENQVTGIQIKLYTVSGGGHIEPSILHNPVIPDVLQPLIGNQNKDIESVQHAWNFLKTQTLSNNFSNLTQKKRNFSDYKLYQNYPNPFNSRTEITFQVPVSCSVILTVYNMLGERITTLVDGKKDQGKHTVGFEGTGLASGIYFYQFKVSNTVQIRKCLLMK